MEVFADKTSDMFAGYVDDLEPVVGQDSLESAVNRAFGALLLYLLIVLIIVVAIIYLLFSLIF